MNSVLDLSRLEEIFGPDGTAIHAFIVDLQAAVEALAVQIETECSAAAWPRARLALHEFVGMCGTGGCAELSAIGEYIRAAIVDERYADVPGAIDRLRAALERLRHTVRGTLPLLASAEK